MEVEGQLPSLLPVTVKGPRQQLELCQGRVRMDIRKRFFPPEGAGLLELQDCLDTARDTQGGIFGVSVQDQELDQ